MPTKPKIKINDDTALREQIDALYEPVSQVDAAGWALRVAKHIVDAAGLDYHMIAAVTEGFAVNEQWQSGQARMHDVRQAGFKVHERARGCRSEIEKAALRCAGQAVGSGHMKEHAMVASDYAVKAVGLMSTGSMEAITVEREWQLNELREKLKP